MIYVNSKSFKDYADGTIFQRVSDGPKGQIQFKAKDIDPASLNEDLFAVWEKDDVDAIVRQHYHALTSNATDSHCQS